MKTLLLTLMTVASIPVWGGSTTSSVRIPTTVNSTGGGGEVATIPSAANVTRTYPGQILVRINNQCFGTNLRSVTNPISPDSIVHANMTFELNGQSHNLGVSYPGRAADSRGGGISPAMVMTPSQVRGPAGTTASVYGNVVTMLIPVSFTSTTDTNGNVTTSSNRFSVQGASFSQEVYCNGGESPTNVFGFSIPPGWRCGQYMGQNGPLSGDIGTPIVAADNSAVDITVNFPGQNGFCGGFFSPLMVFMDEARPLFTGVSDFPLHNFGRTSWPEAGSPGYFIAMDRNGDGKIDKADELFGDSEANKNGFEALRRLDSNKDGWISSKDKDFKKLVLWNDKNGNGISEKGELTKLSTVVEKISLAYTDGHLRPIGRFAEEREKAVVILKNKKKVEVVDMWFAPVMRSQEKLSDARGSAVPSN